MVTTLYAGILGILYIILTFFTIKGRFKHQVALGDGGNDDMFKRIRIHGNFAEYVPIALLLLFLVELEGGSENLIHGLGALLIFGRVVYSLGLYGFKFVPMGRQIGMVSTVVMILASSILCVKAYFIF